MENIVESLFGLSPWQVQQQQNAGMDAYASNQASKSLLQRSSENYGRAGGMFAQAGAEAMGMVNPQVEQAKQRQAMLGGLEPNAESIRQRALQISDPKLKFQLSAYANQLDEKEQAKKLAERKQEFAETEAFELKRREANARIAHAEAVLAQKTSSDAEKLAATKEKNQWMYLLGQMQASAKGNQPPKNLTREARLKWELEDGRIDQETYDAAMAATPGAKLLTEQTGAARTAELGFKSVEDNISKLYDPKTKEIKPEANALFGKYDQYRPQIAMSQETIDAANALDSLTNQVMMANLADAKERVGQSFGSMQVQEWDKFTQQLISLKRGLSPKAAGEAMDYVNNFIQTKRGILKTAMGKSGVPAANTTAVSVSNW